MKSREPLRKTEHLHGPDRDGMSSLESQSFGVALFPQLEEHPLEFIQTQLP